MDFKKRLLKLKTNVTEHKADIAACLIIVAVISALGFSLHAWTGDLKGDDSYMRLGFVQYILNNFPHLNWLHQYLNGYPPLEFNAPAYYLAIALLHIVTTLSTVLLMKIILYLSLICTGISAYVLSRVLGIQRILATALSLAFFTMSVIWNGVVIGGSWDRNAGYPFIFISIALVYKHVKEIENSAEKIKTYVATVVVLSISALIQPLNWEWIFIIVLGIYLIGITRWSKKLFYSAKVFLPVAALVAWIYIPLFTYYIASTRSVGGGTASDTSLMLWRWLIYIPQRNSWSIDIGPLVLPIALLGLIFVTAFHRQIYKKYDSLRSEWRITIWFLILAIFFFCYGWLPMPKSTYIMAAYDYGLWFGIELILLSLFLFTILSKFKSFSSSSKANILEEPSTSKGNERQSHFITVCQCGLLLIVILSVFLNKSFLQSHTDADNPSNSNSNSNSIKQIIEIAKSNSGTDYRLDNNQRILTRWLYYADKSVIVTGGRSNYVPHKYYIDWANAITGYSFISEYEKKNIYSEDRPQIWRSIIGGDNNFYSSMFWLDWYGSSGPILLPTFYPQVPEVNGYSGRPQYFQQYEFQTGLINLFFFQYPESSPITISTHAHVIAIPFQSGDAPQFYTDLLDILSSLNLNSQWIIPVKLDGLQNFENFDTAIVDYNNYNKNKSFLNKYVENGGHLIVMGDDNSHNRLLTVVIPTLELSFNINTSPLEVPLGSTILAETNEGSVAYTTNMRKGTFTLLSMTLNSLVKSNSPVAAILLAKSIVPGISANKIIADMNSTSLPFITNGTKAYVSNEPATLEPTMTYETDLNIMHNQVNWVLPLTQELSTDSNAVISLSLWDDGNTVSPLAVTLGQEGKDGYLYYNLPDNAWNGWKDFTIPLSYFQWKEGKIIDHFNIVCLCFNEDSPYSSGAETMTFKVRDVSVTTLMNNSSYSELGGTWERADKFTIDLGKDKQVLWKETYMPNWKATDNYGRKVNYYFAGPGMIYLVAPADATSITFEMPISSDRLIGASVSILSLIGFISYCVIRKRNSNKISHISG